MQSNIIKCLFFAILFSIAAPVHANFGIFGASGDGTNSVVPYRAAISWDFGPIYCAECNWGLSAVWESSFAFWKGKPQVNNRNDKLDVFTSGPVFRWQKMPRQGDKFMPFFEAGIAPSWLSRNEIAGRRLSIHYQFQDHAGLGVRFGSHYQYEVTCRIMHYSNASIKRPNSGINFFMVQFGVWFGA